MGNSPLSGGALTSHFPSPASFPQTLCFHVLPREEHSAHSSPSCSLGFQKPHPVTANKPRRIRGAASRPPSHFRRSWIWPGPRKLSRAQPGNRGSCVSVCEHTRVHMAHTHIHTAQSLGSPGYTGQAPVLSSRQRGLYHSTKTQARKV